MRCTHTVLYAESLIHVYGSYIQCTGHETCQRVKYSDSNTYKQTNICVCCFSQTSRLTLKIFSKPRTLIDYHTAA